VRGGIGTNRSRPSRTEPIAAESERSRVSAASVRLSKRSTRSSRTCDFCFENYVSPLLPREEARIRVARIDTGESCARAHAGNGNTTWEIARPTSGKQPEFRIPLLRKLRRRRRPGMNFATAGTRRRNRRKATARSISVSAHRSPRSARSFSSSSLSLSIMLAIDQFVSSASSRTNKLIIVTRESTFARDILPSCRRAGILGDACIIQKRVANVATRHNLRDFVL